ncbi:hypothetical protein L208DRAFT_894886 [Tricholoma matsutake]|nr:hypothetical protein L208DRAFT_894886 [Tricholoma matsutake 945]
MMEGYADHVLILSKKYQNAGLRNDLKPNSKNSKVSEIIDPFESGGLADEDVVSVRPSFPSHANRAPVPRARTTYPEDLQRNHLRKNDLVEVALDQSESNLKIKVKNSRTKLQKKEKIKHEKKAEPAAIGSTAAEFIDNARWTNVFLPTISHALYISQEPVLDWTSESRTFLGGFRSCVPEC